MAEKEKKQKQQQEQKHKQKQVKQQKFRPKSWYSNRYQFVLIQRNILLIFALVAMICVSAGMALLNQVISSKSLEPYLIEFEDKTGIPTVVDQLTVEQFTGNELMRKYFLNQYINSSTGYNAKTYPEDSEKVRIFSNPKVFSDFRTRIQPRKLGTNTRIKVRIKSMIFASKSTAQIRILQSTITDGMSRPEEKNMLVTLNFYFDPNLKLNSQERLLNPLGFQVKDYAIVEEIIDY